MRPSRQASKLKQDDKADGRRVNSNTKRTPNRSAQSDIGFLLLSAALKPLYVSPQAAEILFHPEKPAKSKDFADQLASKVHTMVANGGPRARIPVCKEFLSGSRHYICRFFNVQLPGNKSNGTNGSSLALLLERGSEATADVLKVCEQYHLTQREAEAVRFLAQGLASKEIAVRMDISPNTVKVFLRLAMMKMGVTSRSRIMSKFIHAKT